jgi:hypothetical protein
MSDHSERPSAGREGQKLTAKGGGKGGKKGGGFWDVLR